MPPSANDPWVYLVGAYSALVSGPYSEPSPHLSTFSPGCSSYNDGCDNCTNSSNGRCSWCLSSRACFPSAAIKSYCRSGWVSQQPHCPAVISNCAQLTNCKYAALLIRIRLRLRLLIPPPPSQSPQRLHCQVRGCVRLVLQERSFLLRPFHRWPSHVPRRRDPGEPRLPSLTHLEPQ